MLDESSCVVAFDLGSGLCTKWCCTGYRGDVHIIPSQHACSAGGWQLMVQLASIVDSLWPPSLQLKKETRPPSVCLRQCHASAVVQWLCHITSSLHCDARTAVTAGGCSTSAIMVECVDAQPRKAQPASSWFHVAHEPNAYCPVDVETQDDTGKVYCSE